MSSFFASLVQTFGKYLFLSLLTTYIDTDNGDISDSEIYQGGISQEMQTHILHVETKPKWQIKQF